MFKKIILEGLKKTSKYFAETSLSSATTGWLYEPPLNDELRQKIKNNMNKKNSK